MSAQPVHEEPDPRDPQVILERLPERERPTFLRQYRAAVDAAHEPAGYGQLQRILHYWSLVVIAVSQPGYYEAREQARRDIGESVPIEEAYAELMGWSIEDATAWWLEKVEAARLARQNRA